MWFYVCHPTRQDYTGHFGCCHTLNCGWSSSLISSWLSQLERSCLLLQKQQHLSLTWHFASEFRTYHTKRKRGVVCHSTSLLKTGLFGLVGHCHTVKNESGKALGNKHVLVALFVEQQRSGTVSTFLAYYIIRPWPSNNTKKKVVAFKAIFVLITQKLHQIYKPFRKFEK